MTESNFGDQLRKFRLLCHHIETGKPVTQYQFAEYVSAELGHYTGAAISDWELGKSKVGVNDRLVLNTIIRILKQHGGIKSLADANLLLESGDYRAVNPKEQKEIFPEHIQEGESRKTVSQKEKISLLDSFVNDLFAEFQEIINKEKVGPPPVWPRVMVSLIRKTTDSLSWVHVLKSIAWAWIFLFTYWLLVPSLQFPFINEEVALKNMVLYIMGTLLVPFAIGLMINIKNNSFWREQKIQKPLNLRLYVFQGAYVGFHVGYFILFFLTLMLNQLNFKLPLWIEMITIVLIILVSYAGAHLVPYNLWRAFGQLNLKDGAIFFVFITLGPLWGIFFLEFHKILTAPILGAMIVFISLTVIVVQEVNKSKKNNKYKN